MSPMRSRVSTRRLGLAVLMLLWLAGPGLAQQPDPPELVDPGLIHRLGADARQLRFTGETDARNFPIYLTEREARAHAHVHLVLTNAVSVMSEASRLRVSVNDVPVSESAVASPTLEERQALDIDLPPGLLEPGYNALRIEVQQRHRVDFSIAATK